MDILSFGCGIQTVTLYFMSSLGMLPRVECAIFADTQDEKQETYDYLKWLTDWQQVHDGIPIMIRSKGKLSIDLKKGLNSTGQRFVSIPAYTIEEMNNVGMVRRQCTSEYKIEVVNRAIRELYGLRKYQRTPKTNIWIGISIDEAGRMDKPMLGWQTRVYPFCGFTINKQECKRVTMLEKLFSKQDCINWLKRNAFPVPPKSACKYCPFQSDYAWWKLKTQSPKEFEEACQVDDNIRDASMKGSVQKLYLHESCKPLREIELKNDHQNELFDDGLINECKGFCGV